VGGRGGLQVLRKPPLKLKKVHQSKFEGKENVDSEADKKKGENKFCKKTESGAGGWDRMGGHSEQAKILWTKGGIGKLDQNGHRRMRGGKFVAR